MLGRVDSVLAGVTWLAAALLVLMLFVGPQVIAEDEPAKSGGEAAGAAPYSSDAPADGQSVFTDRCGSCHTLSAAGTTGQVGPNLDEISAGVDEVEAIVRDGQGTMPGFDADLSAAEIRAVAEYVAGGR